MKIGLAMDTYKPYISGVTIYVSHLKEELECRGHEAFVFTFGKAGDAGDEKNVIFSPGIRLRMGYGFGFRYSRDARRLLEEMDVIHLHHPYITGQLILAAVGKRKPLIFTAHTRYDLYMPLLIRSAAIAYLRWYFPRFCSRMAKVVGNSPASVEAMRNLGVRDGYEVVPNGIKLDAFQRAAGVGSWRKRLGDWPTQYIYVGRIAREKNLPLLIEAFSMTAAQNPNAGLAIIGSGPQQDELRKQVQHLQIGSRVHFTGAIPHEQLPDLIGSADVFVMSSLKDSHPLTVIEAMAGGLPCVVVDSPAYQNTVLHQVNGWVSQPDPAAFSQAMDLIGRDVELRKRLGAAASRTANEFSIVKVVDRLLEIYTSAITGFRAKEEV